MSAQLAGPRTEETWPARPVLSFLVRLLVYLVPLVAGLVAAQIVASLVNDHVGRWSATALTLTTGVGTSWLLTRATTRLMPLAVLLRMTMLFPDHAPSRLAVAKRTTSTAELTARLANGEADEREAATTLLALVTALGRHDRKTRGHSERVRLFCDLLGKQLGLDESERGRLRWAALVHDIGKLDVAARTLNKPGRLDAGEWVTIESHPAAGARLARPLEQWLGPWFAGIAEHHERYDGAGYPLGLKGTQISLAGRAVAVVDAFETMTAARSYKSPTSTWSAREELTRCAGSHFDPTMVRAFLQIALPSVLRAVGPLAFVVNVPFLRWVGQGTVHVADAASGTVVNAVAAAGLSAVVVAGSSVPSAGISTLPAEEQRAPVVAAEAPVAGAGPSGPASNPGAKLAGGASDPAAGPDPSVEPAGPASTATPTAPAGPAAAPAAIDPDSAPPRENPKPAAKKSNSPEPDEPAAAATTEPETGPTEAPSRGRSGQSAGTPEPATGPAATPTQPAAPSSENSKGDGANVDDESGQNG